MATKTEAKLRSTIKALRVGNKNLREALENALAEKYAAGRGQAELDWFRGVCAEVMGVDAPGGNASHPLRAWLQELRNKTPSETSIQMLKELSLRGGHPGALAEAALLCAKKSEDYNRGAEGEGDIHNVNRDLYFPLGLASYSQMLHTKSMRLLALARSGNTPNFESARDTALDIINYAGFLAAWLAKKS